MAAALRTYRGVLEWDEEDKVWNVSVPALPGCFTFGKTREEALRQAAEAITCHIEGLKADGLPIPDDVPAEIERVEVNV